MRLFGRSGGTLGVAAAVVTMLGWAGAAVRADSPPGPDELTERSAASWGADAQYGSAEVQDDTVRFRVGEASIRFGTDGGFDTWLWAPLAQDGEWDFSAAGFPGPSFWVYAENPNIGFQSGSPWIKLFSTPDDYVVFSPAWDILNDAGGQWLQLRIPLNGDGFWTRSVVGNHDLTDVNWIEIHADTWDAGFSLWIDGLAFDVPLSPPARLSARTGNARIWLEWSRFVDISDQFDHYAIYRDTAPFDNVKGMTPLATIEDIDTLAYTDATAENGTAYYYAVTAVLSGGAETTSVKAVGPRTPRDETDLQVVSISRTPRYERYAPNYTYYEITEPSGFGPYGFTAATGLGHGQDENTPRWPEAGDPVTYTATLRNRGTNGWDAEISGVWTVDGQTADTQSQSAALEPGDTTTFALIVDWDGESHEIAFTLDVPDARDENDALAIDTKGVAFLSYVDEGYIENFRAHTPDYPDAATDDFLDWLNRHMGRFNRMFAEADTPKRVFYDVLEVLADDAPDPNLDTQPFAVFPFRFRAAESDPGDIRWSGYYSRGDDIDYGLLHEMGHQLGLIDLYRLDLAPDQNEVSRTGYLALQDLMHGCSPFLSEHSAAAMTHWYDTAHGYYGQYLYQIPEEMRLRILDVDGQPLSGATIQVFQKCERPGLGEVITTQVKAEGATDAGGEWTLPNVPIDPDIVPPAYNGDVLRDNPFGYVAVVGTNGLLLLRVQSGDFVDYAWLDITEANVAYWNGQTDLAIFERRLALGGETQYFPPIDAAELNVQHWSSWSQDGTITLSDDTERKIAGEGSIRVDATGGYDNYVRYPYGVLAQWDLSGEKSLHVSFYAENDDTFQSLSPWVRLGNFQDGYFEWLPPYDVLNDALFEWVTFEIPIEGDDFWTRSTFGSPDLHEINYIEFHADTWGAGFLLWVDGVGFDPPPLPPRADMNCDRQVDFNDIDAFVAALISREQYEEQYPLCRWENGDIDGNGSVDFDDIDGFVQCLIEGGCP